MLLQVVCKKRLTGEHLEKQDLLAVFESAIIHQDQNAWRIIWQTYQPGIKSRIKWELAGWVTTQNEIEDLTQTVFLKFWQDTSKWKAVKRLYSKNSEEGVLSRLHSTAIYTVQKYRQKHIRKWIPVIRRNYESSADSIKMRLQEIAGSELSLKYRSVFLMHLKGISNEEIFSVLSRENAIDTSAKSKIYTIVNRAWERFIYILLRERQKDPDFDSVFQHLISIGENPW